MHISFYSPPSTKRSDLQGLRGLAILSVLGFHFLPKTFPNGYLGVDQFFVLSGFLMSMLLRKPSNHSTVSSFVLRFYQRRLKRIVPLYFLVISISLVGLFYFVPDSGYESIVKSGERAVVFWSNQERSKGEDYFWMLCKGIDPFTHMWSLSVEVQFYLIIPILYLLILRFTPSDSKIQFFTLLALGSYFYSTVFCDKQQAFNSMRARIWQFMIGMIVNIESEKEIKSRRDEKLVKYGCLLTMLWIIGYPREFPDLVLRPFFTISTGILILLSSGDSILSFPILTYIGDISYSLYLIHWPFYAYWKLVLSDGAEMNWYLLTVFLVSVVVSVICYELFEKWYLKLPNKSIAFLSIGLFLSSIFVLEYNRVEDWLTSPGVGARLDGLENNQTFSFEKVTKLHRKWSLYDYRNLYAPTCHYEGSIGPLEACSHTGLDEENGKYRFMLLGNSWAANHARIFYDECKGKAKRIYQYAQAGCDPLVSHRYDLELCVPELDLYIDQVEKEKPDYLFLLSRMIDIGDPLPPNVTSLEDDPIFQSMRRQFHRIHEHVKKRMFVLNPLPDIDGTKVAEFPKK
uniref:Acyl_transf_3 domain-containing protein n=1 Tax=Caenorhabditis tropicalis TaxID=1561998 RepID=A0A1I7SXP6_9PELO